MTLLIIDNLLCPLARHGLELPFLEALHSSGIPEEQGSGGVMRQKIQSIREEGAGFSESAGGSCFFIVCWSSYQDDFESNGWNLRKTGWVNFSCMHMC